MRHRKINKILGTVLAITLSLTIVGGVALLSMMPSQAIFKDNGFNLWNGGHDFGDFMEDVMGNGSMHGNMHQNSNLKMGDKLENIRRIEVDRLYDHVEIIKSNDETTWVSYDGENTINLRENRGTLTIRDSRKRLPIGTLGQNNKPMGVLTIHLGIMDQKLDIELSHSNLSVQQIQAQSLEIEMGVGELLIASSDIKEQISIDSGTASVHLNDVISSSIELDLGVGSTVLDLVKATRVEIDGGVGSVLINASTITTLETDLGTGSLDIRGSTIENHRKD